MPGGAAEAMLVEGKLRFLVNGRAVIERVFVAEEEAGLYSPTGGSSPASRASDA